MSDKLVSLNAVINIAMQYCPDDDGSCSKADVDLREMLDELENLSPAVPQEMSAVEFFAEYRRMCEYIGRCATCPFMEIAVAPRTPCRYLAYAYPEKAVAIVEKWAREHPERSEE